MSIDSYTNRKVAVKILKLLRGVKLDTCFCNLNCELTNDFASVIFNNTKFFSCKICRKTMKEKNIKNVLLNSLMESDYEDFIKGNNCDHIILKGLSYYYAFNYLRLSCDIDIYCNSEQIFRGVKLKQKTTYSKVVASTYVCDKYNTEIDVHKRLFYPSLIDENKLTDEIVSLESRKVLVVECQKIFLMLNILRDGECSYSRYLDYKFLSMKVNEYKLKTYLKELGIEPLEKVVRNIISSSLKYNKKPKRAKINKLYLFLKVFGVVRVINHLLKV